MLRSWPPQQRRPEKFRATPRRTVKAIVAKLGWKIVGGLTGVTTTMVTRKVLNTTWTKARGGQPPINPEQREVSWPEAITWTIASTAGMAVSRLVTQRIAAGAWEKATGSQPPGLQAAPEPPTSSDVATKTKKV